MSNIQSINDQDFENEVIGAKLPVLVDFWAPWCGPCKAIAPILEEVVADYEDKVKIVKMNVDESPATPPKFGVRGIPTLILFKEGQVQATQVGAVNKAALMSFIDKNI